MPVFEYQSKHRPEYRRAEADIMVVPYNPWISLYFTSHINVEFVSSATNVEAARAPPHEASVEPARIAQVLAAEPSERANACPRPAASTRCMGVRAARNAPRCSLASPPRAPCVTFGRSEMWLAVVCAVPSVRITKTVR